MASVLTNAGSMAALDTLRSISRDMSTTQNRISSGLKVEQASDNAAYWSIATTMKAESSSLSVVGEALGMGSSLADIANTAVESLVELMSKVRDRVVAAGESTTDKAKIQTELTELFSQIDSTVNGAAFNKVNWLTGDNNGTAITEAEVLSGANGSTLTTINVNLEASANGNVAAIVGTVTTIDVSAAADAAEISGYLATIDTAMADLTTQGATFGAATTRIDLQKDFISSITDAIDRGVGSLVDADMNEESTRLKALQTQQQLAVQSLSIANSNTDLILQLFR
ncbi:flagellin [Pseudorhizobium flavum]|uniref:Flagellin n=1 Tax=Pseudorhizobium flavum TaxID=1335061 RepID=A0A7W9Z424_9HYPH|nr:flagellin [Pseudorhizobium flavum]MBB6182141.1 flagellin [Pseudorhizobium flavum]CAD6631969.1 flagellin [Pseudorhizobium flavum]